MVSPVDSALSGIRAASTRLAVAANNIANKDSTKTNENGQVTDTPYVPKRVDLVSLSNAGVKAQVRDVTPSSVTTPDPDAPGGTQERPNVDLAKELIEIKMASYDFKANIKTLKVQDNLEKSLLDIVS
jgi:flagellar basal-body rod protein FlgC